ncbi:hypothetical protein GCM10010359_30780 [Streptomyces morookaense]|nr:hypothetical protein GCM10010359_30780 [Streptomyces morookaense]
MSRATGTATGGAGVKRSGSARTVTDTAGARGSDSDGETGAVIPGERSGSDGSSGTRSAGRGRTVTETRGPKPYHPPKAYEPPADRSGPDSASESGPKSAAAEKGARGGKGAAEAPKTAKAAKAAGTAQAARKNSGQEPAAAAVPAPRTAPRTRKARLRVAKADPWSVMKVSFLLSLALGVCTIVAAAVLWTVLDAMGVFSAVGGTISDATSGEGGGFDLESFLSLPHVLLFTSVIAVIDVVLATALATLGAFVYNLSAGFTGGVELTLAEDE